MNEEYPMLIALVAFTGTIFGTLIAALSSACISKKNQTLQLRLAALDKRLEVHQEAYKLCALLSKEWIAAQESRNKVQAEFEDFWNSNCLYLGSKSREALAEVYKIYVRFGIDGMGNNIGSDFHNARMKAIRVLASEMNLPALEEKDVLNQRMHSITASGGSE
jgi:hypothetical protein